MPYIKRWEIPGAIAFLVLMGCAVTRPDPSSSGDIGCLDLARLARAVEIDTSSHWRIIISADGSGSYHFAGGAQHWASFPLGTFRWREVLAGVLARPASDGGEGARYHVRLDFANGLDESSFFAHDPEQIAAIFRVAFLAGHNESIRSAWMDNPPVVGMGVPEGNAPPVDGGTRHGNWSQDSIVIRESSRSSGWMIIVLPDGSGTYAYQGEDVEAAAGFPSGTFSYADLLSSLDSLERTKPTAGASSMSDVDARTIMWFNNGVAHQMHFRGEGSHFPPMLKTAHSAANNQDIDACWRANPPIR